MASQSDTRTWTDRDGNGSALDAAGNVQFNELGASTNLNLAIPGGAGKIAPGLPRATNWEESVSVQHELLPARFGDRRLLPPAVLQPPVHAEPGARSDDELHAVPDHRAGQRQSAGRRRPGRSRCTTRIRRVVNNNITTWSTNNTQRVQRLRSERECAHPARLHLRRHHDRADRRPTSAPTWHASNPNNLRFCDQTPPFRTLYKGSAAYTLPYRDSDQRDRSSGGRASASARATPIRAARHRRQRRVARRSPRASRA